MTSEPDLYPEDLFDLKVEASPWRIAHVRSRCEKSLARHLFSHEIEFYLPLQQRTLRHSGRERTSLLPLFPGYVFFRGAREARLTALRSNKLVRLIEVEDQELLHLELATLRSLQEGGFLLVPHPYVSSGDRVEIIDGVFSGYEGTVIRERDRDRLIVGVTLLRQSVSIEIGRDGLRPVHGPESVRRLGKHTTRAA